MAEPPARLVLVGSSDEYLLEESLKEQVKAAAKLLGDATVIDLGAEVTPERLADEVVSGSLFDPRRVLLVRDVGSWLQAPAPVGGARSGRGANPSPLVSSLQGGVPEDVVLLMGAWCGGKPRGPLVELVRKQGTFLWIPLPAKPKPWEDAVISAEEAATLRRILQANAPELQLSRRAEELLFTRLGFAPRLLVSEAAKLAAAAGPGNTVEEELVRRLCFPRERSLEAVRDAILERNPAILADLIEAVEGGIPVRDWQGRPVDSSGLPFIIVGQVLNLVTDLLVLRRILAGAGKAAELDRERVADGRWYQRRFKNDLGPWLLERLDADTWGSGRKRPSLWSLGNMVRGAARYGDRELIAALAASGGLEERLRSSLAIEALSAWLTQLAARSSSPAG